jgi:hypothetical protein
MRAVDLNVAEGALSSNSIPEPVARCLTTRTNGGGRTSPELWPKWQSLTFAGLEPSGDLNTDGDEELRNTAAVVATNRNANKLRENV